MPKGFAPLAVWLILAVVILGGGVVVYQKVLAPTPTPTTSPSPIIAPTVTTTPSSISQPSPTPDPTAGWKIHTDSVAQFSVSFPSNWNMQQSSSSAQGGLLTIRGPRGWFQVLLNRPLVPLLIHP